MHDGLLTDEALSLVGSETDVPCVPLTRTELQRFLVGIGHAPTELADDEVDVPPMIYQALSRPPIQTSTLTDDGTPTARRPPVGRGQGMNGETELDFRRPLRIGDRLHGRRRLQSLEPKQGRRRAMVIATWLTEFTDQEGETVIVETVRQLLF